jgi:hypothetical protein
VHCERLSAAGYESVQVLEGISKGHAHLGLGLQGHQGNLAEDVGRIIWVLLAQDIGQGVPNDPQDIL